MKNGLYEISSEVPLTFYYPTLLESKQKIVWSETKIQTGVPLLFLKQYDIKKGNTYNLSTATVSALFITSVDYSSNIHRKKYEAMWSPKYCKRFSFGNRDQAWSKLDQVRERAKEEFSKTGKIKGSLFLTPGLQKLWVSHYDIKYLEEIS